MAASAGVFVAAGVLTLLALRGRRWAPTALALLAVADLAVYGISYIRWKPAMTLDEYRPTLAVPVDSTYYRISLAPNYTNGHVLAGYKLMKGFVAFSPDVKLDPAKLDTLRIAGVTHLVADIDAAQGRTELQGTRFDIRAVPSPQPRVRLVSKAIVADDLNAAVAAIDIAETAVVEKPVSLTEGPRGTARITSEKPGDVTITATAPTRQLLVFAERFHEGWKVAVDGEPAEVVVTYGDFMGCVVEPGEHEARFVFEPESLRLGKQLSLVGLALAVALFFVSRVAFAVYRPDTEHQPPAG